MTDGDAARRAECDRYREMAEDIRKLVPHMKHVEAAEDMRLLAVHYEALAEYVEAAPYPLQEEVEEPRT